jgi:pyruvate/2-oxoglutarate dehydrogenase complex dihydrolipoamide dehydrogenase (E3) component
VVSPGGAWPRGGEGSRAGGLDLDTAAITSGPQATPVDDYLRTNVEHIFAAGDINGRSKLVQSARLEDRIAAWNAVPRTPE